MNPARAAKTRKTSRPPGVVVSSTSCRDRNPGAAAAQPGHEGDQVLQGPGQPVQARDDEGVAGAEEKIFGKHVLITDHDDWPAAEVIAGYRSQSEAEFSFRQMKDPRVVSFSPMFHWTEHNIRVHVLTCVLALQIAHLLRLQAERAGLHMSVRELLRQLASIGETVLIYPAERGRPKARRILTETTAAQDKLIHIFQLNRHAPSVRS